MQIVSSYGVEQKNIPPARWIFFEGKVSYLIPVCRDLGRTFRNQKFTKRFNEAETSGMRQKKNQKQISV